MERSTGQPLGADLMLSLPRGQERPGKCVMRDNNPFPLFIAPRMHLAKHESWRPLIAKPSYNRASQARGAGRGLPRLVEGPRTERP